MSDYIKTIAPETPNVKGCPVCGSPTKRADRTYCSKSCSSISRGAKFRGETCSVDGCRGEVKGFGYCVKHYARFKKYGTVDAAHTWMDKTDSERFWMKVSVGQPDECWPWLSVITSMGYGEFRTWRGGRTRFLAHRYALMDLGADIDGLVVMHSCDNPPCCNPAHLTPGTQAENIADAISKGRLDTSGLEIGWELKREQGRLSRRRRVKLTQIQAEAS